MIDGFSVHDYVRGVRSGAIVACYWVRMAVERHVRDLREGKSRGLYFDESAAMDVLEFFSLLKHSKGKWANQPVKLEPWQQFLLWCVFGWKKRDGTRRFRIAYLEVARKNGKSTIGAGVGLYLLVADGEKGPEIYSAGTKLEQAKICWIEAARMTRRSPMLSRRLQVFGDKNPKASACNINMPAIDGKFEPLGADASTLDGLNIHGAIVDEIHAHKTRDMWDVLRTGMGARSQPLMFGITTAGFDRQSLCWSLNEFTKKVLDRIVPDEVGDDFFGLIFTLDERREENGAVIEADDWQDPQVWIKSNPCLGVIKSAKDLQDACNQAKEIPSQQNSFLRLELNVWTQSETKWLSLPDWKACGDLPVDVAALAGRKCWAGLDLSSTSDLTAFVLCFPPLREGDPYVWLPRLFIPDDNMQKRSHDDRVPYDVWCNHNYLTATPGNVIDYDYIFAQVEADAKTYQIDEIAFDRWGAARVVQVLQSKGLTCVEFGQGFASMSPPMKEAERLIKGHKLAHLNHPVMTWCADNVVAVEDPAGNIKPDKAKSREKIDGFVAGLMALDRAMRHAGTVVSVYQTRGVRTL